MHISSKYFMWGRPKPRTVGNQPQVRQEVSVTAIAGVLQLATNPFRIPAAKKLGTTWSRVKSPLPQRSTSIRRRRSPQLVRRRKWWPLRDRLCRNEFESRKRELLSAHPGAQLLQQRAASAPGDGPSIPGEMAAFKYDDLFGGQRQSLRSESYVFCYVGGRWSFEYRFTYPEWVNAQP
jgi:hypothetical protein